MDILRQSLAPIHDKAWEEINEQAKSVLHANLSARKFVDVEGPKGWDYGSVSTGHLDIPNNQKGEVKYGVHRIQPMVESRVPFELDVWELDNIVRGAQDADLAPLEEAARKMAEFEENAIFKGLKDASIDGLVGSSTQGKAKYPENPEEILDSVSKAIGDFRQHSIEGPYSLIIDTTKWEKIAGYLKGYPLKRHIENLIGGSIILAPLFDEMALLVSERGGDFKLTLGTDISVGYESHNEQKVKLYFTESFTFQIFEPNAVIVME